MPPVQPPGEPPVDGGGEGGTHEMFVASAMAPFLSDGQLVTLSVYHLAPDDEVVWTVTAAEDYNYLLSADGVTGTDHIALLAYFGGILTGTCTVNGESVGSFDFTAGANIPSPALSPLDPTP